MLRNPHDSKNVTRWALVALCFTLVLQPGTLMAEAAQGSGDKGTSSVSTELFAPLANWFLSLTGLGSGTDDVSQREAGNGSGGEPGAGNGTGGQSIELGPATEAGSEVASREDDGSGSGGNDGGTGGGGGTN